MGNESIKSTSVKVTLNGKPLGIDAFIGVEEIHEFVDAVDANTAEALRADAVARLTTEILANFEFVKQSLPTRPATPAPVQQAAQVATPTSVAQAAAGGLPWQEAPNRFDSSKKVRYLPTSYISEHNLRSTITEKLATKNFNMSVLKIWDERTGNYGAESGHPITSVASVKLDSKVLDSQKWPSCFKTTTGKPAAFIRAHFDTDGSVRLALTKAFSTWLNDVEESDPRYQLLFGVQETPAAISGPGPSPVANEEEEMPF